MKMFVLALGLLASNAAFGAGVPMPTCHTPESSTTSAPGVVDYWGPSQQAVYEGMTTATEELVAMQGAWNGTAFRKQGVNMACFKYEMRREVHPVNAPPFDESAGCYGYVCSYY